MEFILKSDSPLHFLPKELNPKQLMVFDSLRFTLEMADYTYCQLIEQLEKTSKGLDSKKHFIAFNYAWSFIDHCQRFVKLYKTLNPPEDSIICELDYLEKFRDAIQHVDKNLEKSHVKMIDNGRPIFGALKWIVNDIEKNEIFTTLWISGIFNIENIQFKQHAQNGYLEYINDVKLETDTMKKNYENEINLSQTHSDMRRVVDVINKKLSESFNQDRLQMVDWKSRKDVILNMKNE
jgi:hypothetical protein